MRSWSKRIVVAGVATAMVLSLGACRKELAGIVLPQAGDSVTGQR